ncbi:MAG: phosphate signaling complex protein PhoU [Acholeplasma sp.]|nr:phosphate signaling complex protein PhoU [Acholeplasma sp.]
MRTSYQESLVKLKQAVIEMADHALINIENGLKAFKQKDAVLATLTIQKDNEIDALEETIAKDALKIIWKEQPIAQDLRLVTTILKVITDIERIADHATDISEIYLHLEQDSSQRDLSMLFEMALISTTMVKNAIDALVKEDAILARMTIEKDDSVDLLYKKLIQLITTWLKDNVDDSNYVISVLLIGKYLERVADHAVNIAEWVIFLTTGHHKNTQLY